MVRAGISLPALMHLMGHAQIHTTMRYVQLAPQDVWHEYARAVAQRVSFIFSGDSMSRRALSLEQICDAHLRVLATTLQRSWAPHLAS
jgi:hypothetical protein